MTVRLTITPTIINTRPRITPTNLPVNSITQQTRRQISQKGYRNQGTEFFFLSVIIISPFYAIYDV
jgi:hypothetical protein